MDSKPMNELKTAQDLSKRFEEMKSARQRRERDWRLNLAFYKGQQYVFYNRVTRRIESLPIEDADKPRHRVRITANRTTRGVQGYVAKLTKTKPILSATPESGDDNALKAAQVAEALMETWWLDLNLREKLIEALTWSAIGQGYWCITWDAYANKAMQFVVGPDGKPITDEALKTLYLAELEQNGIDPKDVTKTVYMGDISVEALNPFDVFIDDSAKVFADAKFAIHRCALTPEEIKARYGVTVQADAEVPGEDDYMNSSFSMFDYGDRAKSLKYVYYGYFIPSPEQPKGRYVVWIDGGTSKDGQEGGGQILVDEDWPFPFRKLNIIKFPGIAVPGCVYDSTLVEHAIPLQKDYNRTISQIVEHKNLTVKPQWKGPYGAMRTKYTTEPGAYIEYNPINGLGPEPVQITSVPSYVFEYVDMLRLRLDEMFFDQMPDGANLPPNVESGIAIDLLAEMSSDRLAPVIGMMEDALADAGNMMLALAQQYYVEPRMLKIAGSGSKFKVRQFTRADIQGGVTIRAEAGSGLPRTRAGRQAQIMAWVDKGIIPPDRAWKYFEVADMKAIGQMFMADEEMAQREHERMIENRPVNEMAMQDMMMQIQQSGGLNPQTQQPIQDQNELQQLLQEASLQPFQFENTQEHIDVHQQFMKSVEWESLPADVKQRFVTHYNLSYQKLTSIPPQPREAQPVRTTLSLHGTVGPTGAAEILRSNGVPNINPDIMQEPPLETVVFDNVDKQNPGEPGANVGNDPYAEAQLKQWQQEQQMMQQELSHEQSLRHADELHQQKVKQLSEQARAKTSS